MALRKRSSLTYLVGIAVAFGLPLSIYGVVRGLSKDKLILPGYYTVGGRDSAQAGDLRGTNQLGQEVSLNSGALAGKILAVSFIFTNCNSVCPRVSENVRLLQGAFAKTARQPGDTSVQLISVSVDPVRDSVPALRAYADRHGANHDRWWYIRASRADVARYMRTDLGLAGGAGEGGADDLQHSQQVVLLDRHRRIRGYYDGTDPAAMKHCADDIVLLGLEKDGRKGSRIN